MKKPLPTAEYVRSILRYDPESGHFTWLETRNQLARKGDIAGSVCFYGYTHIMLDKKMHKVHRLAHLVMTGEWPENDIDHINGARSDNRWSNLRPATRSENMRNKGARSDNTSGFKGVSWSKVCRKWGVRIRYEGKYWHLGYFDDPELAALMYAGAARLLFGDFSHATVNITINNYFNKENPQ